MRKSLLFILLFISTLLSAQQKMVITLNDTTLIVPVWKVDNISFQDFQKPDTSIPEMGVNLGLKSGNLWAPWNLGANKEDEVGFLLGWGNPDSTNLSTDLKYFYAPSGVPNVTDNVKNITDTEFDVAKTYWGDLWRMPTLVDFQELMECKWEWDDEKMAYRISNPEAPDSLQGNCIYIPVTGKRLGVAEPDSSDFGFYWSGTIAENKDSAVYLRFPSIIEQETEIDMNRWDLLDGFRSKHFAVRPVYGEYQLPINVSSSEAIVTGTTATVTVTIEGEGENVQYYLLYGKNEDPNEENAEKKGPYTIAELLGETVSAEIILEELDFETTYYYRAVAVCDDNSKFESTSHQFETGPDERIVNLGLSVKWARWNVGAESEGETGYRVRWGALSETDPSYGEATDISGNANYDIASSEWGSEWRMPTKEEFEELLTNCVVKFESVGDIKGLRFYRNGDSVFMPFAGIRSGSRIGNLNGKGFYWISSGYSAVADFLKIEDVSFPDWYTFDTYEKGFGLSVRAVYGKNEPSNFIENPDDVDPGSGGGEQGGGEQGGGQEEPPVNPIAEDVEAIDLGLSSGTLWANKNVGAENSGQAGSFYAWGETETKTTYLLTNYSQYNEGLDTFQSPYRGDKGIQGTEQDVAHIVWGGNWVMPSPSQFDEIVEQCDWEWTTQNGSNGYLVKSKKNSNSIFLPVTGYYNGASRTALPRGYYWTSSLYLYPADWDKAKQAMEFVIENSTIPKDMHYQMDTSRQYGLTIRPVKLK